MATNARRTVKRLFTPKQPTTAEVPGTKLKRKKNTCETDKKQIEENLVSVNEAIVATMNFFVEQLKKLNDSRAYRLELRKVDFEYEKRLRLAEDQKDRAERAARRELEYKKLEEEEAKMAIERAKMENDLKEFEMKIEEEHAKMENDLKQFEMKVEDEMEHAKAQAKLQIIAHSVNGTRSKTEVAELLALVDGL